MAGLVFGVVVCALGLALGVYALWLLVSSRQVAFGFLIQHPLGTRGKVVAFLIVLIMMVYFLVSIIYFGLLLIQRLQ